MAKLIYRVVSVCGALGMLHLPWRWNCMRAWRRSTGRDLLVYQVGGVRLLGIRKEEARRTSKVLGIRDQWFRTEPRLCDCWWNCL